MNFIKGPVCRGQVALNVIDDQFWVFFVQPDEKYDAGLETLLADESDLCACPPPAATPASCCPGCATATSSGSTSPQNPQSSSAASARRRT